jgi:ubiquinone/menaquinone biosynthesis C-methylase UbiE
MSRTQTDVFVESEGNRWFERNQKALEAYTPERDPIAQVMQLYSIRPTRLLELGAANGVRVAALSRLFGCEGTAVEPAEEAVADGRRRHPEIRYVCSPLHLVPLAETFDVVIVNFVLHWVDRSVLFASLARIDAMVRDGGHLIIGDFSPSQPTRTRYHHLPSENIYTYKQDYAAAFKASCMYDEVAMVMGSHGAETFATAPSERDRSAVWLLRRRLTGQHADVPVTPPA